MDEYDNGTYGILRNVYNNKSPATVHLNCCWALSRFILNICRALIILTCEFVP